MPMIRVSCFGISILASAIGFAIFGDVCTFLNNSQLSISTIADLLQLSSFNIVAHSRGGFIACLKALNAPRCNKAMLLCSKPDSCDALSRMYELARHPDSCGLLRTYSWVNSDLMLKKPNMVKASTKSHGKMSAHMAWYEILAKGC
jgi:hypothetical protein